MTEKPHEPPSVQNPSPKVPCMLSRMKRSQSQYLPRGWEKSDLSSQISVSSSLKPQSLTPKTARELRFNSQCDQLPPQQSESRDENEESAHIFGKTISSMKPSAYVQQLFGLNMKRSELLRETKQREAEEKERRDKEVREREEKIQKAYFERLKGNKNSLRSKQFIPPPLDPLVLQARLCDSLSQATLYPSISFGRTTPEGTKNALSLAVNPFVTMQSEPALPMIMKKSMEERRIAEKERQKEENKRMVVIDGLRKMREKSEEKLKKKLLSSTSSKFPSSILRREVGFDPSEVKDNRKEVKREQSLFANKPKFLKIDDDADKYEDSLDGDAKTESGLLPAENDGAFSFRDASKSEFTSSILQLPESTTSSPFYSPSLPFSPFCHRFVNDPSSNKAAGDSVVEKASRFITNHLLKNRPLHRSMLSDDFDGADEYENSENADLTDSDTCECSSSDESADTQDSSHSSHSCHSRHSCHSQHSPIHQSPSAASPSAQRGNTLPINNQVTSHLFSDFSEGTEHLGNSARLAALRQQAQFPPSLLFGIFDSSRNEQPLGACVLQLPALQAGVEDPLATPSFPSPSNSTSAQTSDLFSPASSHDALTLVIPESTPAPHFEIASANSLESFATLETASSSSALLTSAKYDCQSSSAAASSSSSSSSSAASFPSFPSLPITSSLATTVTASLASLPSPSPSLSPSPLSISSVPSFPSFLPSSNAVSSSSFTPLSPLSRSTSTTFIDSAALSSDSSSSALMPAPITDKYAQSSSSLFPCEAASCDLLLQKQPNRSLLIEREKSTSFRNSSSPVLDSLASHNHTPDVSFHEAEPKEEYNKETQKSKEEENADRLKQKSEQGESQGVLTSLRCMGNNLKQHRQQHQIHHNHLFSSSSSSSSSSGSSSSNSCSSSSSTSSKSGSDEITSNIHSHMSISDHQDRHIHLSHIGFSLIHPPFHTHRHLSHKNHHLSDDPVSTGSLPQNLIGSVTNEEEEKRKKRKNQSETVESNISSETASSAREERERSDGSRISSGNSSDSDGSANGCPADKANADNVENKTDTLNSSQHTSESVDVNDQIASSVVSKKAICGDNFNVADISSFDFPSSSSSSDSPSSSVNSVNKISSENPHANSVTSPSTSFSASANFVNLWSEKKGKARQIGVFSQIDSGKLCNCAAGQPANKPKKQQSFSYRPSPLLFDVSNESNGFSPSPMCLRRAVSFSFPPDRLRCLLLYHD